MKKYFTSRIFQKGIAALSGGFLVLFLIGHLAGNLQLFIPGELGQKQFNAYALFMTSIDFSIFPSFWYATLNKLKNNWCFLFLSILLHSSITSEKFPFTNFL